MTTSIFILNEDYLKYLVEQKISGIHVSIHKKDGLVKIFSEQKKDLTSSFPTLVMYIKKLSKQDFIIDGGLVQFDGFNYLSRSELMKYIGKINSGKKPDDRNINLFVWDVVYYNKSIEDLPLKERILYLNNLDFNERVLEINKKITNKKNIKSSILWASKLKGSEGAIIKELESTYKNGENKLCKTFKKDIKLDVNIIKVVPKNRGLYNYLVGIPTDKKYLNSKYLMNGFLVLGHTFNTKEKFNIGDKIKIMVDEVWRHEKGDGINYSIHKPMVLGKSLESFSTVNILDDYVTTRGVSVKHKIIQSQGESYEVLSNELLAEEGKSDEGKEIDVNNFPDRMQMEFNKLKKSGKWNSFVIQWHLRGEKSIHTDMRFKVDEHLEGITLFTPSSIDKTDLFNENPKNIRCIIKVPQPIGWLNVQGRMAKGSPGSTTGFPSYFVIVGKGKYKVEEVTNHKIIFNIKTEPGKVKKMIPNHGEEYITKFNKKLPDNFKELEGKFIFQISHIGDDYIMLFNKLEKK